MHHADKWNIDDNNACDKNNELTLNSVYDAILIKLSNDTKHRSN